MDEELVAQLKTMLRIDGTTEDELLTSYINAASNFIKSAVASDKEFFEKGDVKPTFEIAVLSLAGSYYTYRIALVDTQSYPIDLTLNSIIGQLRGTYAEYKYGGDQDGEEASV